MTPMQAVDLCFPVLGSELPMDHGYPLYAALSRLLPALHEISADLGIAPIAGQPVANGILRLHARSRLRVRLPRDRIPLLLPLAGKVLVVAGRRIRVGAPQVRALEPVAMLFARMVTIKGFTEPKQFLGAVARQLEDLGIKAQPVVPDVEDGEHRGKPCRRVLQIKEKTIVGFALIVTGLSAEGALNLQVVGLGGRRKMGCGFFLPFRNRGASHDI